MPRGSWTPEGGWSAYIRARREGFVADKLCYECGLRPPREGLRRCQVYTDRHARYREDVIDDGMCRDLCGQVRADGYSRCNACLDRHARKQRAKRGRPVDAPIGRRRPRRQQPLAASAVPPAPSTPSARVDGSRKADPAPPAEAALSLDRCARLLVIAALAVQRRHAAWVSR